MKLELPDDHPIAEAIRAATGDKWDGHLFLSLDRFSRDGGWSRLLSYRVDSWTKTETKATRYEIGMADLAEERQQFKAIEWPEIDPQRSAAAAKGNDAAAATGVTNADASGASSANASRRHADTKDIHRRK